MTPMTPMTPVPQHHPMRTPEQIARHAARLNPGDDPQPAENQAYGDALAEGHGMEQAEECARMAGSETY